MSGKSQPLRKLTADQVDEAIFLYGFGMSLGAIASQMGVSRQAMHDLLKRRIELRDRVEALPRKPKTAIRAKRNEALRRYRSRADRITAAQIAAVRKRDGTCVGCGAPGTDIDHILPVSKGGQTVMENLQLLCRPCHVEKSRADRRGVMPSEATQGSTSSAEASRDRAKTSVSPGSDADSPASDPASSLSSLGSQMSFDHAGCSLRTSLGSSPLPTVGTWESFSQRWPTSGMAWRGGFSTLASSEFPSGAVECSLSDILVANPNRRYALSARAATGILRRAAARGRALPAELEGALKLLAASQPATSASTEKRRRSS